FLLFSVVNRLSAMDKVSFAARVLVNLTSTAIKNNQINQQTVNYTITNNKAAFETPNSIFKILAFGSASLYLGAFLAREGASFLEENEIFVPSEDDDDD
ncbi:hypothetical protein PENTCL1PPCAC_28010, partial [Pristionchus entomophagus]